MLIPLFDYASSCLPLCRKNYSTAAPLCSQHGLALLLAFC